MVEVRIVSKEFRVLGDVQVHTRSAEGEEQNNGMVVEGYALKFGTESERMYDFTAEDGLIEFTETIGRGALDDADM